ncbi:nacht domain protein [Colletotrichum kahawae]|uniref:Nacht domain protein n=1 Tax=Colletotrichum kahawae TaxID=34407 RepID=A0AAD9XYV7_COLKA|nr:nacht domain protein [Colletotrichum kahawae]
MSLALHHASSLRTEIRLAQAVSEFEAGLDTRQKAAFKNTQSTARTTPPTLNDVMNVTAEIDKQAHQKHNTLRSFGTRFTNMLQSIQQYAALGDVVVGGSQNLVACGVWAAVRMMLQLSLGHFSYLERLSELFMEAGCQAPRHHAMALIYPKSKALQKYLCEYYIVVVRICQQIQIFRRKAMLSRMMSALDDSELKRLHSDLLKWSTSISGQVEVLFNETLVNETKQASKTREFLSKWSDSEKHRKLLGTKVRWLNACSTYDYQTTWKQTRKKGTSSLISTWAEYQSWKYDSTPSAMLLSGKVGAGKSVTMANIVDDLNLDIGSAVIYFFCRHDLPESLKCRTIIGSLARQYLSQLSIESQLFTDDVPILDPSAMTQLMVSSINKGRTYLLVDGLDECPIEERRSILQCLSRLQNTPNCQLGYSARLSAEDLLGDVIKFTWHISMPNTNPDIESYINSELSRRKDARELVTSDNQLIMHIRKALLEGSNGMFLWVSLQLDAICSEASDHDIREALESLPKDLNETYAPILKNSARLDHRNHHVRLFKFITAAFEPLNIDQIQDVMSVTAGDISWDPSKLINDIMSILKFCGSLVMIDEEEHTVRFVHHTARSFCLGSLGTSLYKTLPFTETEAHRDLGEATLTYLNYGIFDKQLSTRVIPNIDARKLPEKIAHRTIGNARLASNLFRQKLGGPRDIGQFLANLGSGPTTGNRGQDQHPYYSYAERFWLLQSRHVSRPNMRRLWDRLTQNSDALNIEASSFPSHLAGPLDIALARSSEIPAVIWALNYSHVFLFDHLMTSRENESQPVRLLMRRLLLFRAYLKALSTQPVESIRLNMVSEMAWRLLPIAIELGVYGAARRIIQWNSTDDIFLSQEDREPSLWLPNRSQEDRLQRALSDLVQNVAVTKDVTMFRVLVKERLSSAEDNTRMIEGFLRSNIPQEVLLRACFIFTQASIHLESGDFEVGYEICHHLAIRNAVNSHVGSVALDNILSKAASVPSLVYSIFRQACARGNFRVAFVSWPSRFYLTTRGSQRHTFQGDEIELVLQTLSRKRSKLAHMLLDDGRFLERLVHGPAVHRAVILKHWNLAKRLVSLGADPKPLIKFCNENETLHHCILAVDLVGLDFLLGIGMDVNQVSTGPTFPGCTPAEVLAPASSWRRYHPFGKLLIPGVSPRAHYSADSDPITGSGEKHLSEDLEVSGSVGSDVISLIWFYGSSQVDMESDSSWVGRLAFVIAAATQKAVWPYFESDSNVSQQDHPNITNCLEHISELAVYISNAFVHTRPSSSNFCEILWCLDEILGTIEHLYQSPREDWRQSPHRSRFMVQTMLFKVVDVILKDTMFANLGLEDAGVEFGSIWDEFCTILLQRPTAIRGLSSTSNSTANSSVVQDLRHSVFEGNFPWVIQCIFLLRNNHFPSTLKSYVASIRDEWPNSQVVNASNKCRWDSLKWSASLDILRKLGCSEADAEFLYDNFGRYL